MTEPAVRDAEAEDAGDIANLHVASWKTAYRGMINDAALDELVPEDFQPMWLETIVTSPGNVQCAWQDDRLLGFIFAAPILDRDPDQVLDGFVHALHVAPDLKGQGIGRQLLNAGFRRLLASGCTKAGLWVFEKNLASRMFYKRMGGEDVTRQMTDVLDDTVPEIGMQWDLERWAAAEGA